jgi:DNA-binding beta-propeller fold protein YncE
LAQDNRLDLLIGAENIDQTTKDTIGIVYRVKLVAANHQISSARIDTVWKEASRPRRRFVGIAVTLNDEFLVVRDGPDNTSPVDPDSRVLRFKYSKIDSITYKDKLITPLGDFQAGAGISITTLNHPTGIATFPRSRDFVLIQTSDGLQYTAVWMIYTITNDFEGWIPKYDPEQVTGIDFIRPNRFKDARGVAIDRSKQDIFIVDALQDSVVKFNTRGRFKAESYGGKSSGISLNHPTGIAIAENTVYVCDTGNNRIVLFRLSTDR